METAFSTCTRCVSQFAKSLIQIQGIWGQLDSMLVAGQSHEIKEHISGTPARGLVINEQVLKVKESVRDWAVFVHRIITSESGTSSQPVDSSTEALLSFIHSQRGWLLSHELASEFVTDAVAQVKKVSNIISPSGRQHIAIRSATCQAEAEQGTCSGKLYAILREETSKVPSAVYCVNDASHRIEIGDIHSATTKAVEWVRPDEAAVVLGVSYENVKVIAHRENWETKRDWKQGFYSLEAVERYQLRKATND